MSSTKLPRELGVVIKCDWPGCSCSERTATILVKGFREWLRGEGWIRGLCRRSTGNPIKGTGESANAKWDVCPEHAPMEREKAVKRKIARDERIKARHAAAKARFTAAGALAKRDARNAAARSRRAAKKAAADDAFIKTLEGQASGPTL